MSVARRRFVICWLCLAHPALVFSAAEAPARPNILWLITEDTCPDIGCYGHPDVVTPNLDRLAAEGRKYTRAFATNPVCSPSRSAFMTGMYQTTIGAHQHRTKPRVPLPPGVRLISEEFRDAGYFVTNCSGRDYSRPGKGDFNFDAGPGGRYDSTDWRDRAEGQPFFAQIHYFLTHRPFERDKERPIDPATVNLPPYYPDHPVARRDWTDYLESVQVVDRRIGKVLDRLAEDDLLDNTIIFYFSDHGRPHVRGKQWLYDSGIHVPLIIRWPGHIGAGTVEQDFVSLIDLGPTAMALAGIPIPEHMQGQAVLGPNARTRDFIVSARDRCDMTIDRIRCVRDKKYKYIRNYHPEIPYTQPAEVSRYKDFFYPMQNLMTALAERGELTPAQQYHTAKTKPAEELYDLEADPYEINNIADDPALGDVLTDLRGKLDRWIKETGDMGGQPEDRQVLENEAIARKTRYEGLWKERGLPADIAAVDYLKFWEKELGLSEQLNQYPHVVLSNGNVEMSVFLPDTEKGYYRSTRFDWSGIVWQLTCNGHSYFVPRHTPHDPEKNGHAMSLVGEFSIGNNELIPQRYPETKAGETFMKVGAGVLRKPADDLEYLFHTNYELVDPGTWTTQHGKNWVKFTHVLSDEHGYAYTYTKHMELIQGSNRLIIRNTLKNTGTQPILEDHYNHNFFTIDSETPGPQYNVKLAFTPDAATNHPPKETAVLEGNKLVYLQDVPDAFHLKLSGFGTSPTDGRVIIENTHTGAGVDVGGDFPLYGFNLYTSKRAVCPEIFVKIDVTPGETQRWTRTYRFFSK
ncbi:sulfatase [Planctomycetota bacterium]